MTQVTFLHLRTTCTPCSKWYMWVHWRQVSRHLCSFSKWWNQGRPSQGGSTRPFMPRWWTQPSSTLTHRLVKCCHTI